MGQDFIYWNESIQQRRGDSDRRHFSFKSFINNFFRGKRIKARRQKDIEQGYYVDKYDKTMIWLAFSIILLSVFDGFFTLKILKVGGEEINPIMQALLAYNDQVFFLVKTAITTVCVLFAFIHINFNFLRVISMKKIMKGLLAFYTLLISYELFLLVMI